MALSVSAFVHPEMTPRDLARRTSLTHWNRYLPEAERICRPAKGSR